MLDEQTAGAIANDFQTPVFVYDEARIIQTAQELLSFPHHYGLTVRFAMKANPNKNILRLLHNQGIHIDASSSYEAVRALDAGIPWQNILLTAQEMAHNLEELIQAGVQFNACSLHQLEQYGQSYPNSKISIRLNPWLGSWESNRVNVWWPSSAFGIWHKHIDQVHTICKKYNLTIVRVHSHIGCGTNPDVRENVAFINIQTLQHFPDATTLNLWWGFKVWRMSHEKTADIHTIWQRIADKIKDFEQKTGRKIHVEIEPWTYTMANNWILLCHIQDITSTGSEGYSFVKLNTGMTEITRPCMYGSQHPIVFFPQNQTQQNSRQQSQEYLVAWHCCESWDMLTTMPWDPEWLRPRSFPTLSVWDICAIWWAGAYCASMSLKHYNSFPEAPEVLIRTDGTITIIRKRQELKDIWENECDVT